MVPFRLTDRLTLTEIRESAPALRTLLESLRSNHSGSLYFPFSFYGGIEPRPQQPYLNKLPVEFVEIVGRTDAEYAGSFGRMLPGDWRN